MENSPNVHRSTTSHKTTTILKHKIGLISWSFSSDISTLQFTIIIILSTLLLISTPGEGNRTQAHRCYVCLPKDKTSVVAQEIRSTFQGHRLLDCDLFNTQNAHQFQVDCPVNHVGCQLRINGTQVSRQCSIHSVDDCKTANSIEFCYCTTSLCNGDEHPAQETRLPRKDEVTGIFRDGETDDEDLIQFNGNQEGSGFGDDEAKEPPKHVHILTTSTTSTTAKSVHPKHHEEEDPHLKHNSIPGSDRKENPISSNAIKIVILNMNQFIFLTMSFLSCFLVKFQSLSS